MSTETTPPTEVATPDAAAPAEKPPEAKPPAKPADKGKSTGDGYGAAFDSLKAANTQLEADKAALAAKLDEATKKAKLLEGQVSDYAKREAEARLVDKVRAARPDLAQDIIRGCIAVAAEDKKIERYPAADKLDESAAAALALINEVSPAQTRSPAQGGGPGGAPPRQQPQKQQDPLAKFFGPARASK